MSFQVKKCAPLRFKFRGSRVFCLNSTLFSFGATRKHLDKRMASCDQHVMLPSVNVMLSLPVNVVALPPLAPRFLKDPVAQTEGMRKVAEWFGLNKDEQTLVYFCGMALDMPLEEIAGVSTCSFICYVNSSSAYDQLTMWVQVHAFFRA